MGSGRGHRHAVSRGHTAHVPYFDEVGDVRAAPFGLARHILPPMADDGYTSSMLWIAE